ncbi:MAG: type III secretion inner membrane ring lipoprotein SctJ [Methylocystaceae bacterium]|nr:type III secretion inner membrane ring lipoprotein SctJ [Methylocystaceae bacterium]
MRKLVICLIALFVLVGCRNVVYEKLTEHEANEIVVTLLRKGISAEKMISEEGYFVTVPTDQFERSLDILRVVGLPNRSNSDLLDIFGDSSLISSPVAEKAKYVHGVSNEISNSLRKIEGVVDASVHISMGTTKKIGKPAVDSKASVFIVHARNADVRYLEPDIKSMVSNAIEFLNYQNVSVFFSPKSFDDNYLPDELQFDSSAIGGFLPRRTVAYLLSLLIVVLFVGGYFYLSNRARRSNPMFHTIK